jgi:hypothetical protein
LDYLTTHKPITNTRGFAPSFVNYKKGVYAIVNYLNDLILVINATFINISAILWRPVLVVEEAGAPRENHRP